jgi:diguanylate cyclase (GGDEF)-like protein
MKESARSAAGERLSASAATPLRAPALLALGAAVISTVTVAALAPASAASASAPPFVLAVGIAALLLPPRSAALLGGAVAFAAGLSAGAAPVPTPLLLTTAASAAAAAAIAAAARQRLASPATACGAALAATGALPDRRGFDQRLQLEIGRLQRDPGARLSLIICDLVDAAGAGRPAAHAGLAAGALRAAAHGAGAAVRGVDLTARVGEAEIGVILPGAGAGEAAAVAERIRAEIRARSAGDGFNVAVCCGVASSPEPEPHPEALLGGAGRALAAARRAGRDATAVFDGIGSILIGGAPHGADR